jgi:beta-1,4-mannosyl-glycoprotein beta-1,4-N-acetylglucosaminyltransferase
MKVIDCFLFYNELKLLEFKLEELYDVVDYFILIESMYTFVGREKSLYYQENKHLFSKYNTKIIHIVHHENPCQNTNSPWDNEKQQRFFCLKGLAKLNLQDEDIIILSDLDEIIDKARLIDIKENGLKEPIYALEQDMYYYNLNNRLQEKWYQSKIIKYYKLQEYTDNYDKFNCIIRPEYNPDGKHIGLNPILKCGGWHFSYFGDISFIKNKINQFAHSEFAHIAKDSDELFNDKINGNKDILNRENIQINFIKIEDNKYLPENYKMLL